MTHTIRLREPWQQESVPGGGMRWFRTFHRPTGLSERETVWLVIKGPFDAVELNGQSLTITEGRPADRDDITSKLADRNRLMVRTAGPAEERGFSVLLEIA